MEAACNDGAPAPAVPPVVDEMDGELTPPDSAVPLPCPPKIQETIPGETIPGEAARSGRKAAALGQMPAAQREHTPVSASVTS